MNTTTQLKNDIAGAIMGCTEELYERGELLQRLIGQDATAEESELVLEAYEAINRARELLVRVNRKAGF